MDSQGKPKVALTFALFQGDRIIRRETIAQDIVKVGKDARSHLRIDDELASRMHAVIEVASQTDVTLIDLGNEPGTAVNGQRVNKCQVRPGDRIQIGSTHVVFERADVVPSAAPPPAAALIRPPPDLECETAEFTYSMMRSGPDVSPDEVEVAHLSAVEIMISWGANVLYVSHLAPPRSFFVGEELGQRTGCDYFIPSETLGTTRVPIVVERGPSAALTILPRSLGYVDLPSEGRVRFSDLIATGRALPSSEMSGAHEYRLPAGAKARMEMEGSALVFQVSAVHAGRRLPVGFLATTEPAGFLYTGLSFLLHLGLVAAFAFFMPGMRSDNSEDINRDQVLTMQTLLDAAAERERDERDAQELIETAPQPKEGGTGTRAEGEEGSMGNPNTKDAGHRYGVQGPKDNPDPHLAREAALQQAAQFGMLALISTMGGGDPQSPTAAWGREDSSGQDEKSAHGNMFGNVIGESFGGSGLGLSGVGEGGGGRVEGIGLGNFGGLEHGGGPGIGQGIGSGRGHPGEGHHVRAPHIREGVTTVSGRLPPEIIQRIVRQNFGRFRLCYENGLRGNPNLQGRVTVKFMIDRGGAVSTQQDGGSDLPDQKVVQCVVLGFSNLSFPQPEGGMVTVVYPIVFNPGD